MRRGPDNRGGPACAAVLVAPKADDAVRTHAVLAPTALADLAMAYRTVPTSQPWYTAVGFFDPLSVPPGPRYYYLPGHNFGLVSAVVNFNRYPELVVVAVRAFCAAAQRLGWVRQARAHGGEGRVCITCLCTPGTRVRRTAQRHAAGQRRILCAKRTPEDMCAAAPSAQYA